METPKEIALHVMEKDDNHSDGKLQSIRHLMMCARMTQEGVFQREREISFYEHRKLLNQQLIESDNEALILLNAKTIVSQVLYETDIPSKNDVQAVETYKKVVDEYSHYLKVLSLSDPLTPETPVDRGRRSSGGF
ncbi:hypothetical protein SPB21_10830 [Leptothoe sp. ISB3NOV94-8A]|uniref:Uncharacterized protein n=1 Tax=Adonisia turfae CCMR0081 TaxID=2292702 RepID=A0A6M0RN07_9CYAN|nr:hypothetical protein [Adonisia turfae]NEZ57556.1 hypothetical protein [Adonisia turfae CCMR0081]